METTSQNSSGNTGDVSLIRGVAFWGLLALIFIAPLKFGNPIATQATQYPPREFSEWTVGFALDFVFIPAESHSWLNQWFVCAAFVLFVLFCWDSATLKWWRRFNWRQQKSALLLFAALALFAAAQMLSLICTVNFESSHDTMWTFMGYFVLAFLVSRCAESHRQRSLVVCVMTLSVLTVCWFAFAQNFFTMQAVPSWNEIYRVVGMGPEAQHVMRKYADKRIFSTLVYPNTLGGFLALASPMVFATLWQWRHRLTRGALIGLAIVLSAILAAVLGWTRSNGALLAVGVSLGATLLLWRPRGEKTNIRFPGLGISFNEYIRLWRTPIRQKFAIVTIAILAMGILFTVAYGPKRISGGLATFSARLNYWRAAANLATQRPLTGWGAGTFGDLYPRYIKAEEFAGGRIPEEPRMAHNGFLQVASDSGLLGVTGYAGVWILAMVGAARLYRKKSEEKSGDAGMWLAVFAGLVAWTTHELVDFDLYVPGVAAFAFVLAGLVLGARWGGGMTANKGEEKVQAPRVDPKIKIWVGRVVATGVGGIIIVWLLRVSTANYYFIEAKELMFEQQPSLAVSAISEARKRAPLSAFYRSYAGDVYLAMGEMEEAESIHVSASVFAPHRHIYHYKAAITHWQRIKRVDEFVLKSLRRAVELYPANPTYRAALAAAEKENSGQSSE